MMKKTLSVVLLSALIVSGCSGSRTRLKLGSTPEGEVVGKGDAAAQTRQVMENMKAMCEAGGATLSDVVKVTVFVTNIKDLPAVMKVREDYFAPDFPSATAVEVNAMVHPDWLVEIEAIAVLE